MVGEPRDGVQWMTERSRPRRRAGGTAVVLDEHALEPQIDGGQRCEGGPEHETAGERIVRHDSGDRAFPLAEAGIDDLERGDRAVSGARSVESGDAGPAQIAAHDDADLRLERGRDEAV